MACSPPSLDTALRLRRDWHRRHWWARAPRSRISSVSSGSRADRRPTSMRKVSIVGQMPSPRLAGLAGHTRVTRSS